MLLLLLPLFLAFLLLRALVMAIGIALVALFIVARLMVAGGCKAWRWNQARRAQLWADTHRYPLSLPDAREAGR
jgi:ABC-type nickel/cobalt efflux system permease component RcnA